MKREPENTFDKISMREFSTSKNTMVPLQYIDEGLRYEISFLTRKRNFGFTTLKALLGAANLENLDELDLPVVLNLRSTSGTKIGSLNVNVRENGLILPVSDQALMISNSQYGPRFLEAYLLPKEPTLNACESSILN